MVISIGSPTCAQGDGGIQAKVLCFSYFSHLVGRFSFLRVNGVVEVLICELSVRILFASCDSQSIVCPCELNWGRQYCQFVFKLCDVDTRGGGGGVLGFMFGWYVPLACQSPYPIIVYFLANYRPHLSHFLENVIFAIPT